MLKNKKLFLFDIDGTLALGDGLFEGTRELLNYIEEIGGKAYFITNNSTKSTDDYVLKFKKWGFDVPKNFFITAGSISLEFLKENYKNDKIFMAATNSFVSEAKKNGLNVVTTPDEDVSCILVGFDNELTYEKAQNVCELLFKNKDLPYYATNPDLSCPVPFGFVPDCGAICELIKCAVGFLPTFLGKPNPIIVEACLKDSGFSKEETIVVGDRLYTDIACGINANVDTCALFTGEVQPHDLEETEYKPTYSFDTVLDFLNALK